VLVIGAGIVGSRVALEVARQGLRVALVDAGDFGGATSSASSKLIHGGLRYLSTGQFRVVRSSLAERRALERRLAPHLVSRLPLIVAVPKGVKRWRVAAGTGLYAALSGFRDPRGRVLGSEEARVLAPLLRHDLSHVYLLLQEATTNDSRLTLATVAAAARERAIVANHVRVLALEEVRGQVAGAVLLGRPGEGLVTLRCRAAVNATGPWVDHVRRLEDSRAQPSVRLSKGVHVVLPGSATWRAALALWDEQRSVVAVPWHRMVVVGATDTPFEGDPGCVQADEDDVTTLLAAARHILPAHVAARGEVRFAFAGLRVLPPGGGQTSRAPREHVTMIGPAGMVSVAGGKLTMHRPIARSVVRLLPAAVRPRRTPAWDEPLTASSRGEGEIAALVDDETLRHLRSLYGGEADELARYKELPEAFERIHPDGPDVWAQAHRAVELEWALTPEDIARRRTTIAVRGLFDASVRARLARLTAGLRAPA
jgi:glycerol-3-phosphate dehydrogenase